MRQSEGISKRGKRSIPKVGGEIAESEEGDSGISQTIQQNQGVFGVYLKVQDVLRNIILKKVKTCRTSTCHLCEHFPFAE